MPARGTPPQIIASTSRNTTLPNVRSRSRPIQSIIFQAFFHVIRTRGRLRRLRRRLR